MTDLEEKLNIAKQLIEGKYKWDRNYYNLFCQIYPFTTQNLKAQYSFFNLKDKEILTILGSGDQVLELLLSGATKIDTFDINPLAELYFKLKEASFKANITKEEYLNFFRYVDYPGFAKTNRNCFNHDTYRNIEPNLDTDSKYFWSNLFLEYKPEIIREKNRLFNADEYREKIFEKILNYYNYSNFELLKSKIRSLEFSFIESNLKELDSKLTHQYDFIDLSNIIRYADHMWEETPLEKYRKLIDKLIPYLKEDGSIIIGYLYEADSECKFYECYQSAIRNKYFPLEEFNYYYFDGIYDIVHEPMKKSNDAILVYQKTKTKSHNDIR